MHWNHRIVRIGDLFSLAEVFYNDKGQPFGWTSEGLLYGHEDLSALTDTVERLRAALKEPILRAEDINSHINVDEDLELI